MGNDRQLSNHLFDRVAILGLGLMGGSLGLALHAAGAARVVAGYDVAPGVAKRARARGAVDVACASSAQAVAGADLVVLAAPVVAIEQMMSAIAPHLSPEAVVTDLGSTKAAIMAESERALPYPYQFVGGHPMTGSERSGSAAADASLYQGRPWCLVRAERTITAALERVQALAASVGARPLVVEAAAHDAAVATVSHLPLVAATALMLAATESPAWALARTLAAGGFRDTTRVASGDSQMASDICLTNTQPLLACLDAYLATLRGLRDQIARQDPSIESTFAKARRAREAWLAGTEQ